ncbi:TVP38/TMEM64 family protein [Natronoglycomyces albus]|uniref:TVP38/TMEM64 family membrane protein n=1 Tax=Natronoglycomyces albus TaxID=2811108 RepID=A0A895XR11_9ACTN|nr:TVP38/TMEM64 family protein [Natronoglycomyces albus]QSB05595.1 TVP38/TMEM64 family protein [Natronoglycomyces albus]
MTANTPTDPPAPEDVVSKRAGLRLVALITMVGIAAVVISNVLPERSEITEIVEAAGVWGPIIAIVGVAVLLMALVPRTPLCWVAGALFGWVPAMIYILIGTMMAALLGFIAGRAFGREWVASMLNRPHPGRIRRRVTTIMAGADSWLGKHGILGVGIIRLVPAAPYGVVSYLFGTTATKFRYYAVGCLLGSLPGTVGNTAIGAAIWGPAAVPVAVGVLVGLATLTLTLRYWLLRSSASPIKQAVQEEPVTEAAQPGAESVEGSRP